MTNQVPYWLLSALALGCTIENELPVRQQATSDPCVRLVAALPPPAEDVYLRSGISPRELMQGVFYHAYCDSEHDAWSACVGFSVLSQYDGKPGRGCWADVSPTVDCLLDPKTDLDACPLPEDPFCNPYASTYTTTPGADYCAGSGVTYDARSGPEIEVWKAELDACPDGNTYAIACSKPNQACDVECSCQRNGVETSRLHFEGISDLSFTTESWEQCRFPAPALGAGGAEVGP